jgi:hypothetical protein
MMKIILSLGRRAPDHADLGGLYRDGDGVDAVPSHNKSMNENERFNVGNHTEEIEK